MFWVFFKHVKNGQFIKYIGQTVEYLLVLVYAARILFEQSQPKISQKKWVSVFVNQLSYNQILWTAILY